jgi:hypothetical protein
MKSFYDDPRNQMEIENLITRLIVDLPAQRNIPKSQILKEAFVDITKYHVGGSQPSINSCIRVCEYLHIRTGIVFILANWVDERIISYPQALHILNHWSDYEHLLDGFSYGMLKLLDKVPGLL